jgi:hypothetical protein
MDTSATTAPESPSDYTKPSPLAGFEMALIAVALSLFGVSAGIYCLGFLPDFIG